MKPKHANPQFAREEIQSLDGEWTFEILNDPLLHGVPDRPLNGTIQVPFCPEAGFRAWDIRTLSDIARTAALSGWKPAD